MNTDAKPATPLQAALILQQGLSEYDDLETKLAPRHLVKMERTTSTGTVKTEDQCVKMTITRGDREAVVFVGVDVIHGQGAGWSNMLDVFDLKLLPWRIKNQLSMVFEEQDREKKAMARAVTQMLLGKKLTATWKR